MDEVTIGIDIGTSSVKALAVDASGQVLARARVPHALRVPVPDQLEHDAGEAWVRGPLAALDALGQHARSRALSVGVSAMVPSLTAVGPDGVPTTAGLLYGDARGRTPGAASRNPADSGESLAFLRWCAAAAPGSHGYWPAQAVAARALGVDAAIDTSTAATTWPLFTGTGWDPEVAAGLGVETAQLPAVVGLAEVIGSVDDLAVTSGAVDALAEQIVSAATRPGDVLVMCGTTLMTWVITDHYVSDADPLWCIPWHVPGLFVVGGPSNAGGLFLTWAAQLLAAADPAAELDPGRVPVWTPYPRGERVPLHDPDLRAGLHGLDLTMGPEAVRRASWEAAGFVVADVVARSGVDVRRLVASGGGTRVDGWIQALADSTGLPVDVQAVPEGAAHGMAWLGRMALGRESSLADAVRWASIERTVEPDARWASGVTERRATASALSAPAAPGPAGDPADARQ